MSNSSIFTRDDLFDFLSPSSLASIVADVDRLSKGATEKQIDFRNCCEAVLLVTVGGPEAAGMIGDDGQPDQDEEEEEYTETCRLCRKTIANGGDACEAGWVPEYWAGEIEVMQCVCPECTESRLTYHPKSAEWTLNGTANYIPS